MTELEETDKVVNIISLIIILVDTTSYWFLLAPNFTRFMGLLYVSVDVHGVISSNDGSLWIYSGDIFNGSSPNSWCFHVCSNVIYFVLSSGIYFIIQNYKIYKYSDYTNRLIENSAEIWTKGSGTIGGGVSRCFVSNSWPFWRKTRM